MELLGTALKTYGVGGFFAVVLILLCAYGVKMAIDLFKDEISSTRKSTTDINAQLLKVNREIGESSVSAVNSLVKTFQEFSMNTNYNHKEVIKNLDVNHKEVVGHLYEIKKKIDNLPYK